MELAEELAKLHEVQKLDTKIYQREQAISALDSGEGLKATAIGLLKQSDSAKTVLQKAETALRLRELELKGLEQKRAEVHEKLYSGRVNNPKELGDLQKDEEMLDAQVGRLEEDVLLLMEQAERARATESTLADQVSDAKHLWKQTVEHTQAELQRLQREIAILRPERARRAALVEKNLLRRYDEIRERREGIGMAVTGNDACPICHVKLTPQTLLNLREGEALTYCDNCARILALVRS